MACLRFRQHLFNLFFRRFFANSSENFLKRLVLKPLKRTMKTSHLSPPSQPNFSSLHSAFRCLFCDGSRTIASTSSLCNPFRTNSLFLLKEWFFAQKIYLYRSTTLPCDNWSPNQLHSSIRGTLGHADAAFPAGYLIYVADRQLPHHPLAPLGRPLGWLHT